MESEISVLKRVAICEQFQTLFFIPMLFYMGIPWQYRTRKMAFHLVERYVLTIYLLEDSASLGGSGENLSEEDRGELFLFHQLGATLRQFLWKEL